MQNRKKRLYRLGLLYAIILILLAFFMPRQIDWSPSFSSYDRIPYGADAMLENLQALFSMEIKINESAFYNISDEGEEKDNNYILITENFGPDSLDFKALLDLVSRGNQAFIAADQFDFGFLDTLGLTSKFQFNDFPSIEVMESKPSQFELDSTTFGIDSAYNFKSQWNSKYFEKLDSSETIVYGLGKKEKHYNFIKIPFGEGIFYLHNFPYAFTNYYLLRDDSRAYISNALSVFPKEAKIIWDEYYKPNRSNIQQSPFRVLLRYRSFRWAYWLILGGIISYMIFFSKRRQRMIPVIRKPKNENLAFVKTLGSLYYNKGSHKDIFNKRVRIFKEDIHSLYFMKDLVFNKAEAEKLSRKSGKDKKLIQEIFDLINKFQKLKTLSDGQLKVFVRKMNAFYSRK